MSEKGVQLELSDKQREDVRKMLEKYSGKKKKEKTQQQIQSEDLRLEDPDPLETSKAGTTIDWTELTPKTRRYAIVREVRALLVPLILDKIHLTIDIVKQLVTRIGADISSQNDSLTICAITQADPIRVLQIQTKPIQNEYKQKKILIETFRFIV